MRTKRFLSALLLSAGLVYAGSGPVWSFWPAKSGADRTQNSPVVLAQTRGEAAVRVQQLEELLRQMNGRIEDLNFQILQMQEQMRKMQEDNEFRFQQLEGADVTAPGNPVASLPKKNDQIAGILERESPLGDAPKTIDGVEIYQGDDDGLKPETLGQLVFNQQGTIVDARQDDNVDAGQGPIDLTGSANRANLGPEQSVASLELPTDPEQLYELGYGYVQSGDYALAEDAFETFSERFPSHPKIAEARFWVGESLLSRGMYEDAAKVLLDARKKYPDSRMGPQTLLKLGVSLAGMNQRELACATFAEVGKQYPQVSGAVRTKVVAEQQAANCGAG